MFFTLPNYFKNAYRKSYQFVNTIVHFTVPALQDNQGSTRNRGEKTISMSTISTSLTVPGKPSSRFHVEAWLPFRNCEIDYYWPAELLNSHTLGLDTNFRIFFEIFRRFREI